MKSIILGPTAIYGEHAGDGMEGELHPQLRTLLEFFLEQRKNPPEVYAVRPGLISQPDFFSVGDLQRHLNNPLLGPDWIHLRRNGQSVPLEPACLWKNIQTKKLLFMDKELINEQLRQGSAIVLEGLDILDTAINAFTARVDEALPCSLVNCAVFFSQRDNEAYGGHRDTDDVLVVQISGEKLWHVYAPQQRRYFNNSPLTVEQMKPEVAQITMRAGDALYVRAGVPHMCQTPASHSLHLAFDLCDRTPNIEQITHEANNRYNLSCADTYVPAAEVMERYVGMMQSDEFRKLLVTATQQIRNTAAEFRKRMGRTSVIRALDKFAGTPKA